MNELEAIQAREKRATPNATLSELEIARLKRLAERGAQMEIPQAADMLRLIASHEDLLSLVEEMREALLAALPKLAHSVECIATRPTGEWAEHGSVSFENCSCVIAQARAALAKAGTK